MGPQFQAIVIGDSSDGFVRCASNLLDARGLDIVQSPDVYSSVPELRHAGGGIVVGRFDELCKEGGRFFEIAQSYGLTCCCLVNADFAQNRQKLIQAMEQGVLLIGRVDEVEGALAKCSRRSPFGQRRSGEDRERGLVGNVVNTILGDASPKRTRSQSKSGFSKDEFRMTQAELDALLGA